MLFPDRGELELAFLPLLCLLSLCILLQVPCMRNRSPGGRGLSDSPVPFCLQAREDSFLSDCTSFHLSTELILQNYAQMVQSPEQMNPCRCFRTPEYVAALFHFHSMVIVKYNC